MLPRGAKKASVRARMVNRDNATLTDNFNNPNAEYSVGTRIRGAVYSAVEQSTLGRMGSLGRAVMWKRRGDKAAFKREISRALNQVTVGRMGLLGEAISAKLTKSLGTFDDNPDIIDEVNNIHHRKKPGDPVNVSEVVETLITTARNLDTRFFSMRAAFTNISEGYEKIDDRLFELEKTSSQNISLAADSIKEKIVSELPDLSAVGDLKDSVHSLKNQMRENESSIARLRGEVNALKKRMLLKRIRDNDPVGIPFGEDLTVNEKVKQSKGMLGAIGGFFSGTAGRVAAGVAAVGAAAGGAYTAAKTFGSTAGEKEKEARIDTSSIGKIFGDEENPFSDVERPDFSEGGSRRYDKSMSASVRHNNPGAMYPAPWQKKYGQQGHSIIGGGHKIAYFPDAVSGAAANFDLFHRKYAGRKLKDAVAEWSGGNNVDTYLKVINRETGMNPNDVISKEDAKSNSDLMISLFKAKGIQEARGNKGFRMSDEQWQAAFHQFSGQGQSLPQMASAKDLQRASDRLRKRLKTAKGNDSKIITEQLNQIAGLQDRLYRGVGAGAFNNIAKMKIDAKQAGFGINIDASKTIQDVLDGNVSSQSEAVDSALKMLGADEHRDRSAIMSYLKDGGQNLDPARTAWCAAFVNSALQQSGIEGVQGSGKFVANSFQKWGKRVGIDDMQKGDVLVEHRGRAPGVTGGHVGMATGKTRMRNGKLQMEMLGGNQKGARAVSNKWVDASKLMIRRSGQAGDPTKIIESIKERVSKTTSPEMMTAGILSKEKISSNLAGLKTETNYNSMVSSKGSKPFSSATAGLAKAGSDMTKEVKPTIMPPSRMAGSLAPTEGPVADPTKGPAAMEIATSKATGGPGTETSYKGEDVGNPEKDSGMFEGGGSKEVNSPYYNPESSMPSPGDNGYGEYKNCFI